MAFGDADASTPAFVKANVAGKNATTASFTPPNGALLIAFAWHDTAGGNLTNTSAITDSLGLSWSRKATRSKQDDGTGAANGHIAISTATATGAAMTVTTTGTNTGNPAGLYVRVITGADTTTPMDATPVEGTTNAAVVSTSIVTATDGARCFLQVIDWNVAAAMTAGTGQTAVISDAIGATDDRIYLGVTNAVTSPAGSTALSTGSPSSGNTNNWIGIAVRPAAAGGDATATPSTVAATAAVPTPTVSTGSSVTPTTVSAAAAVPTPMFTSSVAIAPTTVAAVATVPTPTAATGSTVVLGGAVAAAATVPTPSVSASGNASVSLPVVVATATVPTPALSTGSRVALAGPVTATAVVPTPTILAVTQVQLQTVVATAAVPTPTLSTGSMVALSAAVAAVAAVPVPSVSTPAAGVGLVGELHGPLPMVAGSITVHTDSIDGAVT